LVSLPPFPGILDTEKFFDRVIPALHKPLNVNHPTHKGMGLGTARFQLQWLQTYINEKYAQVPHQV
jgi:hypothetical protein